MLYRMVCAILRRIRRRKPVGWPAVWQRPLEVEGFEVFGGASRISVDKVTFTPYGVVTDGLSDDEPWLWPADGGCQRVITPEQRDAMSTDHLDLLNRINDDIARRAYPPPAGLARGGLVTPRKVTPGERRYVVAPGMMMDLVPGEPDNEHPMSVADDPNSVRMYAAYDGGEEPARRFWLDVWTSDTSRPRPHDSRSTPPTEGEATDGR